MVCIGLAATVAMMSVATAHAAVRAYAFTGTVNNYQGHLFALPAGEQFKGYFVYDTSSPLTSSNPTNGFYGNALTELFIDGVSYDPQLLRVNNQEPGLADVFTLHGGVDVNDVRLTLLDGGGTVFSSIDIPLSLELDDFSSKQVSRSNPSPGGSSEFGTIETLTLLPTAPAPLNVTVYTDETSFLSQAPIVHTSNFENLPSGGLGNPMTHEYVEYSTTLSTGSTIGSFLRTGTAAEGTFGLANNSIPRGTMSFGSGNYVESFGLYLTPMFPDSGKWRIILSLEDGGIFVDTVEYEDDEASHYRGYVAPAGIRSIRVFGFGSPNVAYDNVSYSMIIPEPAAGVVALSGLLCLAASRRRRSQWRARS